MKPPAPVLFLVGPDAFQQRLVLEELRKSIFPNGSGGLNDDTFEEGERDLAEIFDLANTMPMLAERRLIVLRNAGAPKESDQEKWLFYLENPSPSAVIAALAEKLDKRFKLTKALDKMGSLRELNP